MAKKKLKLTKKQRQKALTIIVPAVTVMISLVLGVVGTKIITNRHNKVPNNLVWAADSSVKIPEDLDHFLLSRNDCEHYKGTNSPKGVGLWAVYQVSGGKFAKIAYGCSWNLSSYIMAVKQSKNWILLPPTEYFASLKDSPGTANGAIPNCSQLEKYKIDKSIEPFCILPDGTAKINEQN